MQLSDERYDTFGLASEGGVVALIKCGECGAAVSTSAKQCPQCGYKLPLKTSLLTWLVGAGLLAAFVVPALQKANAPPPSPAAAAATQQRDETLVRAAAGAKAIRAAMRDSSSFELAQVLDMGESKAVCYSYRSRNGFGGMNAGLAVLEPGALAVKIDEMNGFRKAYKAHCDGRSGNDLTSVVKRML